MINVNVIPTLYRYFASILEYGFENHYSFESIEDFISFSDMFKCLENSDASFIYHRTLVEEMESVYSIQIQSEMISFPNSKSLWLGEAYVRLFFKFHKPIYYIFLYVPLVEMLNYYSSYHEMDWNQLYDLFFEKMNDCPLLKKLIEKNNLSINKLSQLTNISSNTIKWYYLSDENLYKASYANIYSISIALKVNSNIFVKEIDNYTNSEEYDFDKTNLKYRSYYGLYIASYFSKDINDRKYLYNENDNLFYSHKNILKVLWTKSSLLADSSNAVNQELIEVIANYSLSIPAEERKRITIVIFEYNQISEEAKPFLKLRNYGFDKVFIVNPKNVIYISEVDYWLCYITERVKDNIITRAKKYSGGDFGV